MTVQGAKRDTSQLLAPSPRARPELAGTLPDQTIEGQKAGDQTAGSETLHAPTPGDQSDPDAWVTLARLVRPQGRRGELLAEVLTDFPERFSERRRLFLRGPERAGKIASAPREITLQEHWLHKDRLVLKFAGIDSINDAELLRDHDVVIPYAERAPLEDGAVYIGDLIGCRLFDRTTAEAVGEIVDVDRESANMELLVVRQGGARDRTTSEGTEPEAGMELTASIRKEVRQEILVPFAKAYEPHIDLEARRMEMTLPAGLLELDAPLTPEERKALAAEQGEHSGSSVNGKKRK